MFNKERIERAKKEIEDGTAKCCICHKPTTEYCEDCGTLYCEEHYTKVVCKGHCCASSESRY